jgi:hypothetical protein
VRGSTEHFFLFFADEFWFQVGTIVKVVTVELCSLKLPSAVTFLPLLSVSFSIDVGSVAVRIAQKRTSYDFLGGSGSALLKKVVSLLLVGNKDFTGAGWTNEMLG